jgi:hypothetical protein
MLIPYFPFFFPAVFFFGLPIFIVPAATSQFGCLHFGHQPGRPSIRLTHA